MPASLDSLVIHDPQELARLILEDALAIQDRFAAEPVLAKTGHGQLQSAGVEGYLSEVEKIRQDQFRHRHDPRP